MSTLSSANVTDVNPVLKERTHMRLCLNMLIFTHNLGNWLIVNTHADVYQCLHRSMEEAGQTGEDNSILQYSTSISVYDTLLTPVVIHICTCISAFKTYLANITLRKQVKQL